MRLMRQVPAALAALCLCSTSFAEQLQPTGEWTVSTAPNHCVLSRSYGTVKRPLTLNFQKMPLRRDSELVIVTKFRGLPPTGADAEVRAGTAKTHGSHVIAYDAVGGIRRAAVGLEREVIDAAAASPDLTIHMPGEINGDFAIPQFKAAYEALDACAMQLGKSWGIPIEHQKQVKQEVATIGPAGTYFGPEDYPRRAELDRASGVAAVQVSVDENGRATSCTIRPSTGIPSLDQTTCGIFMNRVRFKPALNLEGQRVASYYVNTISWLMIDL